MLSIPPCHDVSYARISCMIKPLSSTTFPSSVLLLTNNRPLECHWSLNFSVLAYIIISFEYWSFVVVVLFDILLNSCIVITVVPYYMFHRLLLLHVRTYRPSFDCKYSCRMINLHKTKNRMYFTSSKSITQDNQSVKIVDLQMTV